MRMIIRFLSPLAIVLILLSLALAPVMDRLIGQWFERDVELRSELVYNAIHDVVVVLLGMDNTKGIEDLFRSVTLDERLLAVGYCSADGQLQISSKLMPHDIKCDPSSQLTKPGFTIQEAQGGPLLVGNFPVVSGHTIIGVLHILHDISFIRNRSAAARSYVFIALALIGLVAALVTIIIARLTLRNWVRSLQISLYHGEGEDIRKPDDAPEIAPLLKEVRQMVRDLDINRRTIDDVRVVWTAETLREIIGSDLEGAEVLVVSNREPYIHNLVDGQIKLQIPASGLVSAMEPVTRACGGAWIAHGSGSADRQTVDSQDRLRVPPKHPEYTLRRIWLTDEEQEGYYYGFSNEGLWPLCHLAYMRPTFRASDWEQYVKVNRRFADTVKDEARSDSPIVWVQDYHFALLPRLIRDRLPNATIITFWHIPWPNAEAFGICPWRDQILYGLLGSTIVGFHTQFHCNNFFDTVDRFLECRIDREHATVSVGGNVSLIRSYPISIAWPPTAMLGQALVPDCRRIVRERLGLPAEIRLGVGVERFDYTKGILERLQAVATFLEQHPEWVGRFTFLQVAAPTRSKLPSYQQLQFDATMLVKEINMRFSRGGVPAVVLLARHHEPDEVYEVFRAADFCIVSSLHDGMNLVAKEFVAARDDESGVLILSTFAGASRELIEALIVNPYDIRGMAIAIHDALGMPAAERRNRMRLMRENVREHNVYRWAGRMLLDAARLRKRTSLLHQIAAVSPTRSSKDPEAWLQD